MDTPIYYRPTKAVIDLQAITHNLTSLRNYLGPDVQIIAVVKANAYGHGDVEVAKTAIESGATMLAVATPDEAVHIRENFKDIDILVLGASPHAFIPYASSENITLTVFSTEWLQEAQQYAPLLNPLKLHIKVDSCMGRIGVSAKEELLELYTTINSSEDFLVDGIFTHFATADEEDSMYFDNRYPIQGLFRGFATKTSSSSCCQYSNRISERSFFAL